MGVYGALILALAGVWPQPTLAAGLITCPGFLPAQGAGCAPQPYTVRAGDTWRNLALRFLGSKSGFAQIAQMNGRDPKVPAQYPKIGETLLVPCTAQSAPTAPTAKSALAAPTQIWRAKAGSYARDVIAAWGKRAGYRVVQEGSADWRIDVPLELRGSLTDALNDLVKGFEGSGTPLSISVYSNKVIKVGNP